MIRWPVMTAAKPKLPTQFPQTWGDSAGEVNYHWDEDSYPGSAIRGAPCLSYPDSQSLFQGLPSVTQCPLSVPPLLYIEVRDQPRRDQNTDKVTVYDFGLDDAFRLRRIAYPAAINAAIPVSHGHTGGAGSGVSAGL